MEETILARLPSDRTKIATAIHAQSLPNGRIGPSVPGLVGQVRGRETGSAWPSVKPLPGSTVRASYKKQTNATRMNALLGLSGVLGVYARLVVEVDRRKDGDTAYFRTEHQIQTSNVPDLKRKRRVAMMVQKRSAQKWGHGLSGPNAA